MAKKLYVGGLPYSVNDSQLGGIFSQAGTVITATVIMDKFSGRSKGFGFVEMSSDEEADKAIQMLNGQDLEGRKIVVNVARPMEERGPRDFSPRGGQDRRGPRGGGRGGFDRRGGGGRY
ncbi:MAG: RNA recognition motif domain-containing protein [Patescibacteria group bacterium]|jgi:RNA recognition motif-containing protein